jgi:dihydropteroate synthase
MGVINVTPDSFSDGGAFPDVESAVAHGIAMLEAGADILDVGGESTRPGADRVSAAEEVARVEPVVAELAAAGALVSIDTMRASTAAVALRAGARMVNDVSGGRADPELPTVVAAAAVPYVVMHWRAHAHEMQQHADYTDVVADVCTELRHRLDAVVAAGVDAGQVVLDPGLGFAKTAEHNWALLTHLGELTTLGRPVLIGASRKSFLGTLLADESGPRPVDGRDAATAAITALAAAAGAWAVRVHDVRPSVDAVRVAAAWSAAEPKP